MNKDSNVTPSHPSPSSRDTAPRFYSEYGEDAWIAKHLTLPERGFYVDIGAMRPDVNSNTAFLRDRGWSGLAIDGHPDCSRWWKGVPARYLTAVLAEAPRELTFGYGPVAHGAESRVLEPVANVAGWQTERRFAISLPRLLEDQDVDRIDFLSIDIEGKEFDVFQPLDLQRFKIPVIVAEYNTLGIGEDYRLRDHLLKTGEYRVVHQTIANLIYVRRPL
jgi:hypothetical protein